MKKNDLSSYMTIKDGYIPAPYVLEEGESINDFYLEPVIFHNENGPDIGVTTCGVIVQDGLYFKDMDNDGVLSPYEDWRNDDESRAKDMVTHLTLKQQAGLAFNKLMNTPVSMTVEGAKGEDGNIDPAKVYKRFNPEEPDMKNPLPGFNMSMRADDSDILEHKIPAGVYRGDMRADASMIALYHNIGTQYLEYEACQGGAAIPYSLHTNPINIGYPDF